MPQMYNVSLIGVPFPSMQPRHNVLDAADPISYLRNLYIARVHICIHIGLPGAYSFYAIVDTHIPLVR